MRVRKPSSSGDISIARLLSGQPHDAGAITELVVALLDDPDDRVERIVRRGHRLEPRRDDHRPNNLLDHRVAEFALALEVVVESTLGDAGVREDAIEARPLEAVLVDVVERRLEKRLTGPVGVSLTCGDGVHGVLPCLESSYVPTSM